MRPHEVTMTQSSTHLFLKICHVSFVIWIVTSIYRVVMSPRFRENLPGSFPAIPLTGRQTRQTNYLTNQTINFVSLVKKISGSVWTGPDSEVLHVWVPTCALLIVTANHHLLMSFHFILWMGTQYSAFSPKRPAEEADDGMCVYFFFLFLKQASQSGRSRRNFEINSGFFLFLIQAF